MLNRAILEEQLWNLRSGGRWVTTRLWSIWRNSLVAISVQGKVGES